MAATSARACRREAEGGKERRRRRNRGEARERRAAGPYPLAQDISGGGNHGAASGDGSSPPSSFTAPRKKIRQNFARSPLGYGGFLESLKTAIVFAGFLIQTSLKSCEKF
jgi:hypothetical protein